MILTTTPTIEGRPIQSYHEVVSGEVIAGVKFVNEIEIINARKQALTEMEQQAQRIGANAVVGIEFDYQVLGGINGMLMVTVSGTAVTI